MGHRKPGRPGLTDEQADRVRDVLRKVLVERYEENASAFARDLALSSSAISQMLSKKNRPSYDTVLRLAAHLSADPSEILAGHVAPQVPDAYPARASALRRLAGMLPPEVETRLRALICDDSAPPPTEDEWIEMALARKREHEHRARLAARLART
jgi:transcriptional regulator with XRE-family HTH domain